MGNLAQGGGVGREFQEGIPEEAVRADRGEADRAACGGDSDAVGLENPVASHGIGRVAFEVLDIDGVGKSHSASPWGGVGHGTHFERRGNSGSAELGGDGMDLVVGRADFDGPLGAAIDPITAGTNAEIGESLAAHALGREPSEIPGGRPCARAQPRRLTPLSRVGDTGSGGCGGG